MRSNCVHVVYSQSLFTLGLIEEYLAKQNVPGSEEMWLKNKNYFRMLLFIFSHHHLSAVN